MHVCLYSENRNKSDYVQNLTHKILKERLLNNTELGQFPSPIILSPRFESNQLYQYEMEDINSSDYSIYSTMTIRQLVKVKDIFLE